MRNEEWEMRNEEWGNEVMRNDYGYPQWYVQLVKYVL
jgi:hypothetical protein